MVGFHHFLTAISPSIAFSIPTPWETSARPWRPGFTECGTDWCGIDIFTAKLQPTRTARNITLLFRDQIKGSHSFRQSQKAPKKIVQLQTTAKDCESFNSDRSYRSHHRFDDQTAISNIPPNQARTSYSSILLINFELAPSTISIQKF